LLEAPRQPIDWVEISWPWRRREEDLQTARADWSWSSVWYRVCGERSQDHSDWRHSFPACVRACVRVGVLGCGRLTGIADWFPFCVPLRSRFRSPSLVLVRKLSFVWRVETR
jgi:hypothetical protein